MISPSFSLKTLLLTLPITLMLAGCSKHSVVNSNGLSELELAETSKSAAVAANSKLQTDRVVSAEVLKQLQENNPSIYASNTGI